jgi:hypothetical protein
MNMPKSTDENIRFSKRPASTADLSGIRHFDKTAGNEKET